MALQGPTLFIGNWGVNALKPRQGAWTVPILWKPLKDTGAGIQLSQTRWQSVSKSWKASVSSSARIVLKSLSEPEILYDH